ncbi:hypothetical protein LR48_Vigan10g163200 [Vigna angularis]|uniref:Aspartate/glutamate/uridylate kinase domain-containing protein n=1 Tax=Phaseolus angularis TaxID=3914 RepID=A0A0L9VL09_PHAAN|nr:hypothetical protein LR48_Vigan10g163200 [Vigna angularis]
MMMAKTYKSLTNTFPSFPFITKPQNPLTTHSSNPSFPSTRLRHRVIYAVANPVQPPQITTDSTTLGQYRVDVLSESLPFLQKFHGKTIIAKYGGAAIVNSMVLVGKVNKTLVSLINKVGATAEGLSARPSPKAADLGFIGEVARVILVVLRSLIDTNTSRSSPPLSRTKSRQPYNINVDTVVGELAATLGTEKVILLTDVAGMPEDRNDPNSLVKKIDIKGVKKMVEEGKIGGGMIPKVNFCVRLLAQGVTTASIIDCRVPYSLLLEILTCEGAGSMITG